MDTETFAKRMKGPAHETALGGPDPLHRESDWSTKQRDADIERARRAGTALADLDENGEPRGREDDDANMRVSRKPSKRRAAEKAERDGRARRARGSVREKWFSDQFIRNASIFAGACLGATYEVATMPATVQNFNKAVYAHRPSRAFPKRARGRAPRMTSSPV